MKEIKKQITITKYQSDDGTIFDKKSDAIHRDKILKGLIKFCDDCSGLGENENCRRCSTCSGKGWLEKVEVWK